LLQILTADCPRNCLLKLATAPENRLGVYRPTPFSDREDIAWIGPLGTGVGRRRFGDGRLSADRQRAVSDPPRAYSAQQIRTEPLGTHRRRGDAAPYYEDYLFEQWSYGMFDDFWEQPAIYAEGYHERYADVSIVHLSG
jgi:hypothetical protein